MIKLENTGKSMNWSENLLRNLNIAINESSVLGIEFFDKHNSLAITLDVLTLPESGPSPDDSRVQFYFENVGRIVVSLRLGHWHDATAKVVSLTLDEFVQFLNENCGYPIQGWQYFDIHEKVLSELGNRVSLDWTRQIKNTHSIALFQEILEKEKYIDFCIWFDSLRVFDATFTELTIEEFSAGGVRWWDGLYKGDPRTNDRGIVPLSNKKRAGTDGVDNNPEV